MFTEDDFLQLSALQHFVFCPRQCALIYIEQQWTENMLTVKGTIMHERVHQEHVETLKDVRIERVVSIHSFELDLSGKADVVEFRRTADGKNWLAFPIDYKHGKPKANDCDKVQLCAQALCLEEMLNIKIPTGALFYGKTRHRSDIQFDEPLRQETKKIVRQLHSFIQKGHTPAPVYTPKCKSCSLIDECLPRTIGRKISVREYLMKEIAKE